MLPSNCNGGGSSGDGGNRTNSFRVRLPRKLVFNSQWCVGLAVLVYPHSWLSLGTSEPQWVRVEWQTGEHLDIPVPAANLKQPQELAKQLDAALSAGSDELSQQLAECQRKYTATKKSAERAAAKAFREWQTMPSPPDVASTSTSPTEDIAVATAAADSNRNRTTTPNEKEAEADSDMFDALLREELTLAIARELDERERQLLEATKAIGIANWIQAYAAPEHLCKFHYDVEQQRFRLKLNQRFVRCVELSEQLAYMLGFPERQLREAANTARYVPDMKGGMSSFFVYTPGLIEPVFIGDVSAPVLRIVNIRGAPEEQIEECYVAIQYHRVIMKEVSEIFVEIRTASGALMPFQYGTCCLTLHFKKIPYF